jgi:hypothetical protein
MTDIVERLRNRALATEIIKGSPALYNDAADVIISLCAENEKLRAALKPFADAVTDEYSWKYNINSDDFRAAAAAIRESGDE